jgi:anaerobic magnesium-protoporphyrin IX monomethyl ester cyclase
MKIILLYPPRENYMFGVTPHVYIEADSGSYPPIGMLYIAAYLEKNTAHEVKVLDAYTEGMNHAQVKEYLEKEKPDIVGIYISTYYLADGLKTAENVKSVNRSIVTVAGGPHPALYPFETAAVPSIDYVMVGEAEKAFTEFAGYIEKKEPARADAMPSVLTKRSPKDKQLEFGRLENLDELPFPARHLLNGGKYRSILAKRNPITTVITSRGCPYRCYFCSNLESGKKVRYRSPNNVVDELEKVVDDYGIRDFLFFDELFTSDKKRALSICEEILKRKLKIRWHCRSRVDVMDEELATLMKKAGCRLIQFGVETGNQRLQGVINKKLDLEKVRNTIGMIYGKGIMTYADFMFGLPTETDEETGQTLKYAMSLKLDYVAFGMFHPIPGSVFYEQGLKEKRFEDFWLEFVKDQNRIVGDHSWSGKDRERYHSFVAAAYRKFYFRPGYILSKLARTDSLSQLAWQAKSAVRVFYNLILKNFK